MIMQHIIKVIQQQQKDTLIIRRQNLHIIKTIKIGADKHPRICDIIVRIRKIKGSSKVININIAQRVIIDKHIIGIDIGIRKIIIENEHNIIIIIPKIKLIKIMIKISNRKNKKNKTDTDRKNREFPSTKYKVKMQPNAPQI